MNIEWEIRSVEGEVNQRVEKYDLDAPVYTVGRSDWEGHGYGSRYRKSTFWENDSDCTGYGLTWDEAIEMRDKLNLAEQLNQGGQSE